MVGQGVEHADNYPCRCDVRALLDASVRHVFVRTSHSDDIDMAKAYIDPLGTACGNWCGDDARGYRKKKARKSYVPQAACLPRHTTRQHG